jgi:hypothetical protein
MERREETSGNQEGLQGTFRPEAFFKNCDGNAEGRTGCEDNGGVTNYGYV